MFTARWWTYKSVILSTWIALPAILFSGDSAASKPPSRQDANSIIQRSVQANNKDYQAAPQFSYTERDKTDSGYVTYHVLMIEGSPYYQVIARNGKPLSGDEEKKEAEKLDQARAKRKSESPEERKNRISKYESDRKRDHALMQELTKAFSFQLLGEHKLGGFTVYALRATPRPDYKPPSMETEVLTGMEGNLWIDKATYHWVRVTAKVIHPVAIAGFLARVEPGTEFMLEKMPVGGDVWQPKHFSVKSRAKVLMMFNHNSDEEDFFSDYRRAQQAQLR
jgi:hypothetical protein